MFAVSAFAGRKLDDPVLDQVPLGIGLHIHRHIFVMRGALALWVEIAIAAGMVLTLQQRVAGKEIEMMVVERAAELGQKLGGGGDADTYEASMELSLARDALALHVSAVNDMEQSLKNFDAEIASLRQS